MTSTNKQNNWKGDFSSSFRLVSYRVTQKSTSDLNTAVGISRLQCRAVASLLRCCLPENFRSFLPLCSGRISLVRLTVKYSMCAASSFKFGAEEPHRVQSLSQRHKPFLELTLEPLSSKSSEFWAPSSDLCAPSRAPLFTGCCTHSYVSPDKQCSLIICKLRIILYGTRIVFLKIINI